MGLKSKNKFSLKFIRPLNPGFESINHFESSETVTDACDVSVTSNPWQSRSHHRQT